MRVLACALAASLVAGGASAHHSMAMFDSTKKLTVTGTLREFQWTNPHCYIQLIAKDDKGADVEWSMELGAPMYLYARGWRPGSIKPGDRINVTINPLRSGQPGGAVLEVTSGDGKPIGKGLGKTS